MSVGHTRVLSDTTDSVSAVRLDKLDRRTEYLSMRPTVQEWTAVSLDYNTDNRRVTIHAVCYPCRVTTHAVCYPCTWLPPIRSWLKSAWMSDECGDKPNSTVNNMDNWESVIARLQQ